MELEFKCPAAKLWRYSYISLLFLLLAVMFFSVGLMAHERCICFVCPQNRRCCKCPVMNLMRLTILPLMWWVILFLDGCYIGYMFKLTNGSFSGEDMKQQLSNIFVIAQVGHVPWGLKPGLGLTCIIAVIPIGGKDWAGGQSSGNIYQVDCSM